MPKGLLSAWGTPRRILFIFGFWWAVPSIIAVFLPVFQRNRLQSDPSYRGEPPYLPPLACTCTVCRGHALLHVQRPGLEVHKRL